MNWRGALFLVSFHCYLVFLCVHSFGSEKPEESDGWKAFYRNLSILDLTAGESKMSAVTASLGAQKIPAPTNGHRHDVVRICYQSPDGKTFVTFSTGYLHDFETMYGFELSQKPDGKRCATSAKVNGQLATPGGIRLGMEKAAMNSILGTPAKKKKSELRWELTHHEIFKEPKISYQEAGPTNARYLQKYIAKGIHHFLKITAKFLNDRLVKLEVFHDSESDFELQNQTPDPK